MTNSPSTETSTMTPSVSPVTMDTRIATNSEEVNCLINCVVILIGLDAPVIIIATAVVGAIIVVIAIIAIIAIIVIIAIKKTLRKRKQVTLTQGTCSNTLILYTINYMLLYRYDTC